MMMTKLKEQIVRHEGLRLDAYNDTVGILTVGVGHNCRAKPVPGVTKVGDKITRDHAMQLLDQDIAVAERGLLGKWPWMQRLDEARYAVMLNMAFNMGISTLSQFKQTIEVVRQGNYNLAAAGMLGSKWARQVGKRATELAKQMQKGEWQQ